MYQSVMLNKAISAEATDEALIDAAKTLNEAVRGHLRRSVEDFWRMGEALSHVFRRRHLQGRWADILAEIGISTTTDNHARRLYQSTTLDGLAEYKNKTAALRALGILSTPSPKTSPGSTPGGEVWGEPELALDHSVKLLGSAARTKTTKVADDEADNDIEEGDERNTPTAAHRPTTAPAPDDSLEVLTKLAARLEFLVSDGIAVTPDHLAQIDRAIRALGLLRRKGVADVA